MAVNVAQPTAGTFQILGAVVIGTLDASGNFVQYATVAYKNPVRVATTANGTLATAFANGQTVDGIVLATGDRILLKNQSAPADNGIYVVAATGAPSRASDMDTWSEVPGSVVGVLVGTTNADTAWLCTSDSGGTIGVTAINFSQFGAGIATPVAANLGGTGVANNAASTLTISGNFASTFVVSGAYTYTFPAGTGTLATVSGNIGTPSAIVLTNATGLPLTTGVTGTLPIANGGTASTTAANARLALGADYFSAVLASDFTVTNSATYATATGMSVTLTAGTWLVEYYAVFNDSDAVQGHKTKLDFGGVSCLRAMNGIWGNSNAASFCLMPWPDTATSDNEVALSATWQYAGTRVWTLIVVPSTAVISLQMAQTSAGAATSASMKAGSWMAARRVA